jgi:branched-chain amino acid transport system permease protein
MVGALGVNQAWLFTGVFALGAFLAAFGGALQLPREPANLGLDLVAIGEAFVVVVVGGMGSIPGAFLAAFIIAEIKAMCFAIGQTTLFGVAFSFSKLTLVVEFLVMAAVLIWRPWGLMGKPGAATRNAAEIEAPLAPPDARMRRFGWAVLVLLLLVPLAGQAAPYTVVLSIDILIAVLFATSLYFIMGPGGMHSFGHAAYFGLGAYGAGLLVKQAGWPMEAALMGAPVIAGIGALVFGWFCVRLSGVYLAMLTLAFAQIVWSIAFQWDELTGGSNGVVGIWPAPWLSDKWAYYYLTLALTVVGVLFLWRVLLSPFGYAMRAGRDSPLRADAIGIDVFRVQWKGFVLAGIVCGIGGGLFAFSKGSIAPEAISVGRSIDGLVMVLLGGVQTMAGPVVGAGLFTWLSDLIAREFQYWRAALGITILVLVLAFPQGVAGSIKRLFVREPA